MTFAGSGFLIESVPVAGAFAAHENYLPIFLPKSLKKFTVPRSSFVRIAGVYPGSGKSEKTSQGRVSSS
jgi:hypothetical protein